MKISVSSEAVKEKIKSSGHNVKMVMRVLENLDKRDKNELRTNILIFEVLHFKEKIQNV